MNSGNYLYTNPATKKASNSKKVKPFKRSSSAPQDTKNSMLKEEIQIMKSRCINIVFL